jgi:hypothetical protein
MSEIVRIPFHGDEILTVDVNGNPHIVLKPAIDAIGLDYWKQINKLRSRSWAALAKRRVQVSDQDQHREMLVCDVRTFLMLLATVDENRVAKDVAPKLIAYQAEVADVIEAYWTRGVVINPRVRDEEAAKVIAIFAQAQVGDPGYWDAKARQLTGRVLGETPDYHPQTTPLTVGTYLAEKGITGSAQRSLAPRFGRALKARYITEFGTPPPQIEDLVNRHMVAVAQYQQQHRPLFDAVWHDLTAASHPGDR